MPERLAGDMVERLIGSCPDTKFRGDGPAESIGLSPVRLKDERKEHAMNDQTRTPITGVLTVGIPVTDQDRALDFYVRVLGLHRLMDVPLEQLGGRWIVVAPAGATTSLALVPSHPGAPAGVATGIRLATSDAAALREQLLDRSVSVGELLQWPGVPPMFAVTDPDGNGLSITELPDDGAKR